MTSFYRFFCHLCNCSVYILTITGMLIWSGTIPITRTYSNSPKIDPWKTYGTVGCIALYFCQLIVLICLPQALFNFGGLVFYNTFPEKLTISQSFPKSPLICFRVVTRGSFPDLVRHNVSRNLQTCFNVGLDNFTIEVVTDKSVQLPFNHRTREIVVPFNYRTKSGILFKARALQYALEDDVNTLEDNDWIVHLDEETLLTESSVRGIVRFTLANEHPFGQGLITYGKQKIVNWLFTFCDAYRAADDMGKLRFQFSYFHKPFYGWKAEKDVSFDHGVESSVAEDCFFAMIAFKQGYSFGFVEGEMWEKSPFTMVDFIHQRKRWLQGILLTVHSPLIPFFYKILLFLSVYSWVFMPMACANIFLAPLYPVPLPLIHSIVVSFIGGTNIYMCMYGAWVCFSISRLGLVKFILCIIGSVAAIPVKIALETIAVTWGVFTNKLEFYVVDKKSLISLDPPSPV